MCCQLKEDSFSPLLLFFYLAPEGVGKLQAINSKYYSLLHSQ
jgi:hypothetical protein